MSPVDDECEANLGNSTTECVLIQLACSEENARSSNVSESVAVIDDGSCNQGSRTLRPHIRQMINDDPIFRRNLERLRAELFHMEWTKLREPPIKTRNHRYHGLPRWITWSLGCTIPFVIGIVVRELVHEIQGKHPMVQPYRDPIRIHDETYMTDGLP